MQKDFAQSEFDEKEKKIQECNKNRSTLISINHSDTNISTRPATPIVSAYLCDHTDLSRNIRGSLRKQIKCFFLLATPFWRVIRLHVATARIVKTWRAWPETSFKEVSPFFWIPPCELIYAHACACVETSAFFLPRVYHLIVGKIKKRVIYFLKIIFWNY